MTNLALYFRPFARGEDHRVMLRQLRRPVLTVLKWQLLATTAIALLSGLVAGWHGALSAVAGGAISVTAGLSAALVASLASARSAGSVVMGALRAEAVKLGAAPKTGCEHHVPPLESDQWRREGWQMIQLPRSRVSKYQCGVCCGTPVHHQIRKPRGAPS